MSNVLGALFGDIANAIRSKTGREGTMKPAEFPAEISSILTGGIVGGGELKFKSGTFYGNGGTQTITHNLGVIPDILMIYVTEANDEVATICFVQGFSSAMLAAIIAAGSSTQCQVYFTTTGGSMGVGAGAGNGMELSLEGKAYKEFGGVHSVTASTFTAGTTPRDDDNKLTGASFPDGKMCRWVAFGGIVGA